MPWRSSSVPAQRYEFVRLAESGQVPFSELCHRFGIGRSTGYKWLERFAMEGPVGLVDRPRRPKTSPGRTSADVEVALAQEEPTDLAALPIRPIHLHHHDPSLWRWRANPTPYDPVPSTPTRITGPNPNNQSNKDRWPAVSVGNDSIPNTAPFSSSAAATCTSACVSTPPNTPDTIDMTAPFSRFRAKGWHTPPERRTETNRAGSIGSTGPSPPDRGVQHHPHHRKTHTQPDMGGLVDGLPVGDVDGFRHIFNSHPAHIGCDFRGSLHRRICPGEHDSA